MDRSWIDGRFGKPVVMTAVAITAALIALAVIATDDNGDVSAGSGTTPAGEQTGGSPSHSPSTSKPNPSRPSNTPDSSGNGSTGSGTPGTSGNGSTGSGSSGTGSSGSGSTGSGSTGSGGSTTNRTSPDATPRWTDDLPGQGSYGKTEQDQDRLHLENIPLTPQNLPGDGHTWTQADRAHIENPGSGRVGSIPSRGRSRLTTTCVFAPHIERVTTMSEIYESDTGFAVGDMTIVTKSAADARELYREMISELGVECTADAAAAAVSETWGWDVDLVRATPIADVNVTGSEDKSMRYNVVAYDETGARRQVEFTTTTGLAGRTILVVITASESRIPGTMIDQIAESRAHAIYA